MLTYLTSHLPPLITTVHLLPFLIHLPTLVSCAHTLSTNPTLPNTNTSAVSGFQDLLTTHPPLARSLTIANPASNLSRRDVHTDLNNYVSTVFPNGRASRFYLTPPHKALAVFLVLYLSVLTNTRHLTANPSGMSH